MTFPEVVCSIYSIHNSDINIVGEYLGYDWNQICEEIQEEGFYAEDGDGAFTISFSPKNDYAKSKVLNDILIAIFEHYPHVKKLQIVN